MVTVGQRCVSHSVLQMKNGQELCYLGKCIVQLLFFMKINDLLKNIKSNIKTFGDNRYR